MPETIITAEDIIQTSDGMTIKFQPDSVGRLSASGKSHVVATTSGFILVGTYHVSINVIKK